MPCSNSVEAFTALIDGELKTYWACSETGKEANHVGDIAVRADRLAKNGHEVEWLDSFLALPAGADQHTKFNALRQAVTRAA